MKIDEMSITKEISIKHDSILIIISKDGKFFRKEITGISSIDLKQKLYSIIINMINTLQRKLKIKIDYEYDLTNDSIKFKS